MSSTASLTVTFLISHAKCEKWPRPSVTVTTKDSHNGWTGSTRFRDGGWGRAGVRAHSQSSSVSGLFYKLSFYKDFLWRKCLYPEVVENAYLSLGCRYVNSELTLSTGEESVNEIILLSKYSGQTFGSWWNKWWPVDSLRFLLFPTFGGPLSLKFSPHSHQRPLRVLCWPQSQRKLKGFRQSTSGSLAK